MCIILFMCMGVYAIVRIFEGLNINMKFMNMMNNLCSFMVYHVVRMLLYVVQFYQAC